MKDVAPTHEAGRVGNAYHFDGSSQYMTIPHHADFNFGTGDFSIALWVYLDDTPTANETFVYKWNTGEGAIKIRTDSGLNLRAYVGTAASYTGLVDTEAMSTGTWYFVTLVRESGAIRLYKNAVLVDSDSDSGDVNTSTDLNIARGAGGAELFDGLIDELWIFDRALSAAEVKSLYTAPLSFTSYMVDSAQLRADQIKSEHIDVSSFLSVPSDEDLKLYYSFDDDGLADGDTVKDQSPAENDGTLTLGAGGGFTDGKANAAMDFGGSQDTYVTVMSDGSGSDFAVQSFSIACWIYITSIENYAIIWSYDYTSHATPYYAQHLRVEESGGQGRVIFYWNDGSAAQNVSSDYGTISQDTWHHVCVTFTSGSQEIWIDGVLAESKTNTDTITYYAQEIWVGRANFSVTDELILDELRFYDRVLTQKEIRSLYLNPGGMVHGMVATRHLVADLITANEIAADAVEADKIKAEAVLVEKLNVLARDLVNNVTYSGHLGGWGQHDDDGTNNGTTALSVVPLVYGSQTVYAVRLSDDGTWAARLKSFEVSHGKVYKVTFAGKVSSAAYSGYVNVLAYSSLQEGAESDGSLHTGNYNVTPYDSSRTAGTPAATDVELSRDKSTSFVEHTAYIIGYGRSIDDCPAVSNTDDKFIYLSDSRTKYVSLEMHAAFSGSGTFDIVNMSVVELGTGQIVAENIVAETITADEIASSTLTSRTLLIGKDNNIYDYGDDIGDSDELFLHDLTCLSSKGRVPEEKSITPAPRASYDSDNTEYENPEAMMWDDIAGDPRADGIGFWRSTTNMIDEPFDYAAAFTESNMYTITEATFRFQNHTFWTFMANSTSTSSASHYFTFSSSDVAVRMIIRKGQVSGTTNVRMYRTTGALKAGVNITWTSDTVALVTPTTYTCEIIDAIWHESGELVEIALKFGSITTGDGTVRLIIYPDSSEADGDYVEVAAVQVEEQPHPTPYTPSNRDVSALWYRYEWAQAGSIELRVRMRCNYDGVGNQYIVSDYDSVNNYSGQTYALILRYAGSAHKFQFVIRGSTTTVTLTAGCNGSGVWASGNTFADNTYLHDWIHIKITWDISNDNYYLDINGTNIDSETATDVGTVVFNPNLSVGSIPLYSAPSNFTIDGEICDMLILATADRTLTHGAATLPWVQKTLANTGRGVAIDENAIRLLRAEIAQLDKKMRFIDVGTQGIRAVDRAGHVIHDIVDQAMLAGHEYLGHLYFFNTDSGTTTDYRIYNGTPTIGSWTPCGVVTLGIENVKGVYFKVYIDIVEATAGTVSGMHIAFRPKGSSWGYLTSELSPMVHVYADMTSATIDGLRMVGEVICPVGTDDEVEFRAGTSTSGSDTITVAITQMGVFA